MEPPVLIVPGWANSGPGHWQSIWQEANPSWVRVEQADWEHPLLDDWLATIDRYVRACTAPPVLVGHSLGSIAIVRWAAASSAKAAGAFLVSPTDVESDYIPAGKHFAPIPREPLRFSGLVVISDNDEYVSPDRAVQFAMNWGSTLKSIGNAGHINTASGHGEWPEGLALFRSYFCGAGSGLSSSSLPGR